MSKARLPFGSLILLACSFALMPVAIQAQGDFTRSFVTVEARRRSLSELTVERDRLRATNKVDELVQTINQIGEVHLKLHDLDSALADAQESLHLARQFKRTSNERLLVDTLIFAARVRLRHQDKLKAMRLLAQALELSRDLTYRHGEAQSLTQLGVGYFQSSQLLRAEKANNEALQIWQELQDKRGEARTLTNQGETYMLLDETKQAVVALKGAETIWRNLGESTELATTLVDLNFLAIRQGQWQTALSLLGEAQTLVTDKEAEPYLAGQIAMSFGEAYEAYGQLDTAVSYFKEAWAHYRDGANDKAASIDACFKAGRVQARLGDYAGATHQIEQGLKLAQEIGDELRMGLGREDLGRVLLLAGLYEPARQEFHSAIAIYWRIGHRRPWARAQTFLGQTEHLLGNLAPAAAAYEQALRVYRNVQDYTNEAALSFGLGKLALEQEKLDEAEVHLKRSITLTEQLRENASSKDLRTSFLASVHDRYETYIEWLMARHTLQPDKGFDVLAFEASESSRARSLLDSVKDYQRELRRAADPALLIEEEKLQKREQSLLDRKAKLLSQVGEEESNAIVEIELKQVRARYEALQAQLTTSSRFTNLLRPAPLKLTEIQSLVTDDETALLEYSLGSQRSYLWVVTAHGMQSYQLADKQTIEKIARKVAYLLSRRNREPDQVTALQEATIELSRLILGPAVEKLNARRLLIVADGILQYVPFQMLTVSTHAERPLVARYEIVNVPSASTLAIVRQESANRRTGTKLIAAFGDPVLPSDYALRANSAVRGSSDEGASNQTEDENEGVKSDTFVPADLRRLLYAKLELNQIRRLGQQDGSVIYSDFNCTRDTLRSMNLSEYRILHFATHGLLNANQPELSGLVLSLVDRNGQRIDGFVGLSDIYNLHAPVDLVVLSACRTALGQDVRGEGLIGLTRGFMYAGASSVVASLWEVDDEATAELMKHFYANMLQHGMPPAAALRAAQNSIREQPQWKAPYYWAAFTLQGEYQKVVKPTSRRTWLSYSRIFPIAVLGALIAIAFWRYFRRHAPRTGQPN